MDEEVEGRPEGGVAAGVEAADHPAVQGGQEVVEDLDNIACIPVAKTTSSVALTSCTATNLAAKTAAFTVQGQQQQQQCWWLQEQHLQQHLHEHHLQ